jgi:hypothetical protein
MPRSTGYTPDIEVILPHTIVDILPEAARNHMRVATNKSLDDVIVNRAVRELEKYREYAEVAEFFATRERAMVADALRKKILALKTKKF